MDKKMAREIVESLPSLYPSMRAEEEEAIWAVLENDSAERLDTLIKALEAEHKKMREMQKGTQPEIIYCKDCVKHNKGVGDFEVLPDGRRSWIWKDRACPLVSWRGKAQGHEFDYQYCVYAERRTDERSDCCDCYSDGRCVGTKEIDPCSCGGNKSKCDFYENVRREGDAE